MPSSGPVGVFSARPQSTAPDVDFEGPIPAGPEPNWPPSQIVSRFLAASASYPTFASITSQYLAGSVGRKWNPGWRVTIFQNLSVQDRAVIVRGGQRATVDVTGTVQATLNSSGEFVSAQTPRKPTHPYTFSLVKVNGQWRIANPPAIRLITVEQFYQNYKPQDLYFYNPNSQTPVLVPDSVFVPQQTSPTTLASNLVNALLQGPKTTWLHDATTSFPTGTRLLNVTIAGDTAVVNLGGALVGASAATLEQVSAQLLWTLAAPRVPSQIQAVQLEVNGQAWIPPQTICGTTQSRSPVQKLAAYGCYDPYPQTQASFSFVGDGTAWSRCGSAPQVAANSIGSVVPVFGRTSRALGAQPCLRNGLVPTQSPATPAAQQHVPGTPSMVAVSPDGQYAAYLVRGTRGDTVYIRSLAGTAPAKVFREPGVTSLSWDRSDDLWFAQNGSVWMVSAAGQPFANVYQGIGNVLDLAVAPDGVRIALIVQAGPNRLLKLTAFDRGSQPAAGQPGSPSAMHPWLDPGVQLGPNLAYPVSLTWYDADNLLVLADTGSQNQLYQVPVDGQPSTAAQQTPPDAISVTAYGTGNALVAGLTGGGIDVAASLEGPWLSLGVHGQNPAYP